MISLCSTKAALGVAANSGFQTLGHDLLLALKMSSFSKNEYILNIT